MHEHKMNDIFGIVTYGYLHWGKLVHRSIINAYSLLLYKWWVPLIKFMVGPTIHVRGGVHIYGTLEVPNNFPYIGSYKLQNFSYTA